MDRHARKLLEFDSLLRLLRSRVPSSLGIKAVEALEPSCNREKVLRRQRQTSEMRLLRESPGDLPWSGSDDLSADLHTLTVEGSWIEPARLYRFAEFLTAARKVPLAIGRSGHSLPEIKRLAGEIPELKGLEDDIRRSVTSDGEVSDGASADLGRIRKGIVRSRQEVLKALERILGSSRFDGGLQEKIITIRSDRYVIPVRAGARGMFRGVIHDRSASGQTLYLEPQEVVEKNNALREFLLQEGEEILLILRSLSDGLRRRADDIDIAQRVMASLELIWAKACLGTDWNLVEPVIFEELGRIELRRARHPLLVESLGEGAIPFDAALGGETRTLVITGPNTGGKTVTLKTIGLLTLMAQSGIPLPADRGSGLSCFSDVLVDIGDEQSLEQNLSTFSGHVKNVIAVLRSASPGALVLLDELGAGTDPSEGAALGIAILERVHQLGALTVTTTHHNAIKVFAAKTPGVANVSMEFDSSTLQPTFRLLMGVPGRSQAFSIAAGLGMEESIIERARGHRSEGEVRLDRLMEDLEAERAAVDRERGELAAMKRQAAAEEERQRRSWEKKEGKLRKETMAKIREGERELRLSLKMMKKDHSPSVTEKAGESLQRLKTAAQDLMPDLPPPKPLQGPLHRGDRIFVRTLRTWGDVEKVRGDSAVVIVDGKRCTIPFNEVSQREKRGKSVEKGGAHLHYHLEVRPLESTTLDIRGLRVDEGISRLDGFLEQALLNGVAAVEIIHGKGTGRLQAAVTERLDGHPRVESFSFAPLEQGGSGMTKVRLAT